MTLVRSYTLLSLPFVIVNLVTLDNQVPWIDEVMFLDTSYNAAVHGSWETTAWYRVAGERPFSTYPPLYQLLASAWIWLFGSRMVVVRSLNLLITFVLGFACLRLMNRRGLRPSFFTSALFTMLLWGTYEMAIIYRNGRPDMLCALMFVFTLMAIERWSLPLATGESRVPSKSTLSSIAVVVTSALLVCSGIQGGVCISALWLFLFVSDLIAKSRLRGEDYAKPFPTALMLTGILLGLVMVSLFMLWHDHFVAFASSLVQYSSMLSSIALTVLPYAGDVFDFDVTPYTQKLIETSTPHLLSGAPVLPASVAEFRSFHILSVVAMVAYASCYRNRLHRLMSDRGFLSLLFALYVPFAMSLAGRFAVYYRWMAFLPLLYAVTHVAARHQLWRVVFGVVAVVLTVSGQTALLSQPKSDGQMHSFVERQHFKPTDTMVCPFSLFYELKPVCDTCYFAGIYPPEYIGHVDYIIEAPDGDEYDQRISNYAKRLQSDPTVVLTAIDHCAHPSLTLYKVERNTSSGVND